ncbi:autotransporter domain-containing protein [Microvirga lotononidis]|uniref:autotransporter domain-containing protein n=1 Tax=Microvirga lotononidis TaxID=864069 RepID=UPI0018A85310|nr:autotransporter domain-containing protein [Microvirga lotononidis]WQO30614.1 autotransporter domain-containing protein [Microvirga lotononidis]
MVTVPGTTPSPWTLTDALYVGDTGIGTLQVETGGQVTAPTVRIGNDVGSDGAVTVSGPGASLSVDTTVRVGHAGIGSLTITNGGTITSEGVFLGSVTGSNGTVVLRDEGSRWDSSGFYVGSEGSGSLRIEAGADLFTSSQVMVGRNGSGTAVVSGPGSTWSMSGLKVGGIAAGTLTVSDGGSITSTGQAIIGGGSQQSSVTVTGAGSQWDANIIFLGSDNRGMLTVSEGASATAADTFVGTITPGSMILTGHGSSLTSTILSVGYGATGTLRVEDGGTLTTNSTIIGGWAGISGFATVTGLGSAWHLQGQLLLGEPGRGALAIENGGTLASLSAIIGNATGATGTVTVTGGDSTWINSGTLSIGESGTGTLTVNDGAAVTANTTRLGQNGTGQGALTLAGTAAARGQLITDQVARGSGMGTLTFNGGLLMATADRADFLAGFDADDVTIAAGGAFLDSNGHIIGTAVAFNGTGDLIKTGAGTLTLSGANTYSGMTRVDGGTLVAQGGSATPDDSAVIVGAGTYRVEDDETIGSLSGTGAVFVANGKMLTTGANNQNATFAGSLTGDGSLEVVGAGTFTMTGTSSLGGNLTICCSRVDMQGNAMIGGDATVLGGMLVVGGSLASTGLQVQSGATLTGSGSLIGGVIVADGGTLAGTSGQTLSMGSLALAAGANLKVELNADSANPLFDVAGDLSLNGRLTIAESSDLSAATSYDLFHHSGALTNSPLVLTTTPIGYKLSNFGLESSSGKVTLNLIDAAGQQYWTQGSGLWTSTGWSNPDGSLLTLWGGDTAVFQGSGGTLTIDGTQSFSALRFEADDYNIMPGTGGALTIAGPRGDVRVDGGYTATIATPIEGAGQFAKGGAGTLILSGINTYQGGTWLAAGTLGISSDANLGDAAGGLAIEGGATLRTLADLTAARAVSLGAGGGVLDTDGHVVTLSGPIEGVGSLTKRGNGTLTLKGLNTYAGGTAVNAGTLLGTAKSFGSGPITNDATLVVDQAADATLANAINGTGHLIKTGVGQLELTGASTLSGPTSVEAGRLAVNGFLASSPVTVQTNAVLSGTGMVGEILAQGGSIIAPGNSIGTLSVNGDVGFAAGSTYAVEINAAGLSDRINAQGKAVLSGGTVQVLPDQGTGYVANSPYTILTARGGVNGTFTRTTGGEFAFVTPTLGYTADAVTLTLVRKTDPTDPTEPPDPNSPKPPQSVAFHSVAVTENQYRTADGVEALREGNRLFDAVIGASVAGARQAFDALSGEAHASAAAVAYGDAAQVQNSILTHLRQPLTSRLPTFVQGSYTAAYAADAPGTTPQPVAVVPAFDPRRFALWGEGFGSWGKIGGNGNAAGLETSTGGFILGADAQVAEAFRLGLAGGFTRTTFDIDGRLSSGSNESVFAALYGSSSWGALSLRLGAAYAWHDIDVNRTVRFPGFAGAIDTSYDGWTAQAFGEVGYRMGLGPVQLEPFVGASVLRLHTDAFQEEGGPAALTGSARDQDLATTTLGLRAEARLSDTVPLIVRGLIGWRHAYGDVEPEALLAFSGGATAFTVAGTPIDRNALVAEAGLDWQASDTISLGIAYSGQVGKRIQEHALKGNFTWRF